MFAAKIKKYKSLERFLLNYKMDTYTNQTFFLFYYLHI